METVQKYTPAVNVHLFELKELQVTTKVEEKDAKRKQSPQNLSKPVKEGEKQGISGPDRPKSNGSSVENRETTKERKVKNE
jgi:hypothetical protein